MERLGHLVVLERTVLMVSMVLTAILVTLDARRRSRWTTASRRSCSAPVKHPRVRLDHLDHEDHPHNLESQVIPVSQEHPDHQDSQVYQGRLESLDNAVRLVNMDAMELCGRAVEDNPDSLAHPVTEDQTDHPDRPESPDDQERLESPDSQDHQDDLVRLDRPETKVHQVTLERRVDMGLVTTVLLQELLQVTSSKVHCLSHKSFTVAFSSCLSHTMSASSRFILATNVFIWLTTKGRSGYARPLATHSIH